LPKALLWGKSLFQDSRHFIDEYGYLNNYLHNLIVKFLFIWKKYLRSNPLPIKPYTFSAMYLLLIQIGIALFACSLFLFITFQRRAKLWAKAFHLRPGHDNDSPDGDGGDARVDDCPTLDLPPGVYVLPPGAPDPAKRGQPVNN
jgi:hypothetical protein